MASVVFLRGVNVGGHRTFRPKALVEQLQHLDPVNIGAAGTFVIRKTVPAGRLRAEIESRLPFATEIVICRGGEVARLASREFFADHPARPDVVRFVSVLSRAPRPSPALPMTLPPSGKWGVKILVREGRFLIGVYRRQMDAIRHLGTLDRVFGAPVTTRNWNTVQKIAEVLERGAA